MSTIPFFGVFFGFRPGAKKPPKKGGFLSFS
jgi:hypothetical protein